MITSLRNSLEMLLKIINYNLKIVFVNKFFYFLLGAVLFFLLFAIFNLFEAESDFNVPDVYNLLLFPGLLLIFYPTTFSIQNDMDSGIIEILFGIPNYRYKVWLVRLAITFVIVAVQLLLLCLLSIFALIPFPLFVMVFQLMVPVLFVGCVAFLLATIIRNGNGTAAAVIILGVVAFLFIEPLEYSKWNIFLNPFKTPNDMDLMVWSDTILKNRLYMIAGAFLAVLAGLFRLQKREKFV